MTGNLNSAVCQTGQPINMLRRSRVSSAAGGHDLGAVVSAGISTWARRSTINTEEGGVLAMEGGVHLGGNGRMIKAALDSIATCGTKWSGLVQVVALRKARRTVNVDTGRVGSGAHAHVDVAVSLANGSANAISTVLAGVWAMDGGRATTLRGNHQVVSTALDAVSRGLGDIKLLTGGGSGRVRGGNGSDVRANSHAAGIVRISLSGRTVAEAVRGAAVRVAQSAGIGSVGANESTSGASVRAVPSLSVGRATKCLGNCKVVVSADEGVASGGTNGSGRISGAIAKARVEISELIGARQHHPIAMSSAVGRRAGWGTGWGRDRGWRGGSRSTGRGTHGDGGSPPGRNVLNQNNRHRKVATGSTGGGPSESDRSGSASLGACTRTRLLLHLRGVAECGVRIVIRATANTKVVRGEGRDHVEGAAPSAGGIGEVDQKTLDSTSISQCHGVWCASLVRGVGEVERASQHAGKCACLAWTHRTRAGLVACSGTTAESQDTRDQKGSKYQPHCV